MHKTDNTNPRVIVVDDDRDAATSLSFLLAGAGFEVETFFDGPSALRAAIRFMPDACVLDIQMPGMSGYELARQLREGRLYHPPLCATVTAFDDNAHLDLAVNAGFDLHFTKPADPFEIADQIRDCLQRQSGVANH